MLNGRDVTDVPPHGLAALGLKRAFQQNAFFAELSVLDNHGRGAVARARHRLLASLLAALAGSGTARAMQAEASGGC